MKLTTVGPSIGFILPKEAAAKLKVQKGDKLYLTEAPDGYRITGCNSEFVRQIKLAEDIMHQNRDLLHALAE